MNDQFIYFIVVEGRFIPEHASQSTGATFDEVARFAHDVLGATWGIELDGGDSSTMIVNGQLMNQPSNPCYPDKTKFCEPARVNGIMMVVQEPMQRSPTVFPSPQVETRFATGLRLGPGTNYATQAGVPGNSQVTIIDEAHNLNGVLAKGSYWWKVQAGDQVGWISEFALNGQQLLLPVIFKGF
jgi:hypothetical protein